MQLNLAAEFEKFIEEKLAEGYDSPERVVEAALLLLKRNDDQHAQWFSEQVAAGIRDVEAGRVYEVTGDSLRAYLRGDADERRAWRERASSSS